MTANVDITLKPHPSSNAFQIAIGHPPGSPPQQLLDALSRAGWAKSPDNHARTIRGKTVLLLARVDQLASGVWSEEQARACLAQTQKVLRRFGFPVLALDAA